MVSKSPASGHRWNDFTKTSLGDAVAAAIVILGAFGILAIVVAVIAGLFWYLGGFF
jgi:hypothetical protein